MPRAPRSDHFWAASRNRNVKERFHREGPFFIPPQYFAGEEKGGTAFTL